MFSFDLVKRADPAKVAAFGIDVGARRSVLGRLHSERTNMGFGDDAGDDMGDDWEGDFGAPATHAPTPAQLQAAHRHLMRQRHHTTKRLMALDPNKHSAEKVEKYIFPLNATLVLGTPSTPSVTATPDCEIRPKRVTVNAPNYGFFFFSQLKIANVDVIIGGSGLVDAFFWNALAIDQELDLPTMQTQTKGTFAGSYNGQVPATFLPGSSYPLVVTFTGPARMAG